MNFIRLIILTNQTRRKCHVVKVKVKKTINNVLGDKYIIPYFIDFRTVHCLFNFMYVYSRVIFLSFVFVVMF